MFFIFIALTFVDLSIIENNALTTNFYTMSKKSNFFS